MATESNSPDYTVQVVAERKGKDIWTRVGVAFKNSKEDHPVTILLNPGVTVSGKLVLSVPKSKDDAAAA